MYKHECVKCLTEHKNKCIKNISFFDRFLGTEKVTECLEYKNIITYQKRCNKKR